MSPRSPEGTHRILVSGAVAGAASALAFTALHDVLISDIWFSAVPMMLAGALSGLCLAWTYGLLFPAPTVGGWWLYNGMWVALLALLGGVSLVVYEPITTLAAVMAGGSPDDLIRHTVLLTVGFTLGTAAVLSLIRGRTLPKAASILVTTTVLVALLGLNVSTLGLVDIPAGSRYLVVEMIALIFILIMGFAAIFLVLERRRFGFGAAAAAPDEWAEAPAEEPAAGAPAL